MLPMDNCKHVGYYLDDGDKVFSANSTISYFEVATVFADAQRADGATTAAFFACLLTAGLLPPGGGPPVA